MNRAAVPGAFQASAARRRHCGAGALLPLLFLCGVAAAGHPALPVHPDELRFPADRYTPPSAQDRRVVLPGSHVPAYLLANRELPLVRVLVYVRTGAYRVPPGKEGLPVLLEYLIGHGGTELPTGFSADELEDRLAYLGADLQVTIGDTLTQVSLEFLSRDLEEGLLILRGILSTPLIDKSGMGRGKSMLRKRMSERNDDAAQIEERERGVLFRGPAHFTNRLPTSDSVAAITAEDVRAYHRRWFHPGNFVLAASGDFDPRNMTSQLDQMVRDWPFSGEGSDDAVPRPKGRAAPGVYLIDKQGVTQGRVSVLLPGIGRDDPDYLASQVLNHVLGGGGRSSRIPARLRTAEGLAYEALSRFPGGIHYPEALLLQFQSRPGTCSYATSLLLEEVNRLRDRGVTPGELAAAKSHLIETLPQRFRTSTLVVALLAHEEATGRSLRDPTFFQDYRRRIEHITKKDVDRVARKWLDRAQALILVVGKKAELLTPGPEKDVPWSALGYGPIREVPLRDPLTLK